MGLKSVNSTSGTTGKFSGSLPKSISGTGNSSPPVSGNYVAEDGTSPYVTEDGLSNYVTEAIGGMAGVPMGMLLSLTYAS